MKLGAAAGRVPRFLRNKKRSNGTEASYRRYSNKKISTTFTLAGVLAASWQISYFLRRDCILRKREGRFGISLFATLPLASLASLSLCTYNVRSSGRSQTVRRYEICV